jgi:hypothetical protein
VTAVPDTGYHFVAWSDGVTTASRTDSIVTANINETASFSLNVYTVTPSAGAHGAISPSTPQSVNHGSTIQFAVTPDSGYTASVGGTCGGSLVGNTYTTNAITADCTVGVSFIIISIQASCKDTLIAWGIGTPSGVYTIDPNGGSSADAFDVYCDMTTNGGGWTLAAKMVNGDTKNWAGAKTTWTSTAIFGAATNLNTGADAKSAAWGAVVAQDFMVTDSEHSGKFAATSDNCLGNRPLSDYFTLALASFPNTGSSSQYATCALTTNYIPDFFGGGSVTTTGGNILIARSDTSDTQGVISSFPGSTPEADYGLGALEDPFFGTGSRQTDVGVGDGDSAFLETVYFWVR